MVDLLNIHTVKRMVHSALLVQWFSLHVYSYSCVMKAIQAAICAENLLSNCSSLVAEKVGFIDICSSYLCLEAPIEAKLRYYSVLIFPQTP